MSYTKTWLDEIDRLNAMTKLFERIEAEVRDLKDQNKYLNLAIELLTQNKGTNAPTSQDTCCDGKGSCGNCKGMGS